MTSTTDHAATHRPTIRRRGIALAAATTAALVLGLLVGGFRAPGAPMEEGKLLVGAETILSGHWPHEAFEHLYGPGDVWTVAGVFAVVGESLLAERAVGAVAMVLLLVFAGLVAARVNVVAALVGVVLGAALVVPFGVAAYSWILGLACVTAAVHLAGPAAGSTDRPRWMLAAAGLLAAGATVYRVDLALAALVVSGCALATWPRRSWSWYFAGLGAGLVPWVVHVALAGPTNVLQGALVDPVFRLRDGRSLPLPLGPSSPISAFDAIALAGEWPGTSTQVSAAFLMTVALLAVLAVLVVHEVVRCRRAGGWGSLSPVACLAGVALSTTPQLLQRPDTAHVRMVASLALVAAPAALVALWRSRPAVGWRVACGLSVVAAGAAVVAHDVTVVPAFETVAGEHGVSVSSGGREFLVSSEEQAGEVRAVLAAVREVTEPGDSIIVWAGDLDVATYSETYLYHLLPELRPGTRHLEANPGIGNGPRSSLPDDLRSADVVVLSHRVDGWAEPNTSAEARGRAGAVAREHFCLHQRTGPYDVLVPC